MTTDGKQAIVAPRKSPARFEGGQIDISKVPASEIFTRELRRVHMRGCLRNYVVPDVCNLIESYFVDVETEQVDFSRCDFKDNTLVKCSFVKTKFEGCGFVLNTINKSEFTGCNFYDTVIQNCEFYDVTFRDCNLTSLVVKDCVFSRCSFVQCTTSNKVFEMCVLNDCHFEETQLQIQTVTENFGLRSENVASPLRSDRTDHPHEEMNRASIAAQLSIENYPLARLALYYYLEGNLLDGSEHLDATLNVGYWIKTQSTIGSFSIVLTRFCEFLLQLHERDELAYLPLVQLHSVTGALASALPADARTRQAEFAVYGAHLSIARKIEILGGISSAFIRTRRRNWTFLVDAKHPKAFYKEELIELFERGRPRIVSLVPHNSPWEMALTFPSTAA